MRELRALVGRELVDEKEQEEAAMEIVKSAAGANRCRVNGSGRSASGHSDRVRTRFRVTGGPGEKQSGRGRQHGSGYCAWPGARHARPRCRVFRNTASLAGGSGNSPAKGVTVRMDSPSPPGVIAIPGIAGLDRKSKMTYCVVDTENLQVLRDRGHQNSRSDSGRRLSWMTSATSGASHRL